MALFQTEKLLVGNLLEPVMAIRYLASFTRVFFISKKRFGIKLPCVRQDYGLAYLSEIEILNSVLLSTRRGRSFCETHVSIKNSLSKFSSCPCADNAEGFDFQQIAKFFGALRKLTKNVRQSECCPKRFQPHDVSFECEAY